MKTEFHTESKPNKNTNDDIAGSEGRTYWLMDGATQLVPSEYGADWHVGQLDKAFRKTLAVNPDMPMQELVRGAIARVADEFARVSGVQPDAPQELRPFATLIMCRLNENADKLDYMVICDSTLAVVSPEHANIIADLRIDEPRYLDPTDALLRQGKGFDTPEFKSAMKSVYDVSSRHINRPGGFDVVGQEPSVVDRAYTGTLDVPPGSDVLLMSDGFTRAVDTLKLYPSYRPLLAAMKDKGAAAIIREIREAERADGEGLKYQRSSRHDDATVLWLRPS